MKPRFGPHLIVLAAVSPRKAITQLRKLIADARVAGDVRQTHACEDLFVAVAARERLELDEATGIAKRLVDEQPDATHLRLLAMLYIAQGNMDDAERMSAQADQAEDQHIDATGERIMNALFPK